MGSRPTEQVTEQRVAERSTAGAFAVLVTIAGGNAVAVRYMVADDDVDPFWAASMRFLLAGLIFAGIALALRTEWPRGRALLGGVLYGALTGGGYAFAYWSLVRVPAGLGQVILAFVPLLTFALALAHRQERFRLEGLIGAALAVSGIAIIFGSGIDEGLPLTALIGIIVAAVCWAEASIVVKAFPPVHPVMMNAIGMMIATAILLALAGVLGEASVLPEKATAWIALAYLVTIGSVGVFALYLFVLSRWSASAASYEFVLIPLVTIGLSAWLLDEKITGAFTVGSVLVLIGVYFGALRGRSDEELIELGEEA